MPRKRRLFIPDLPQHVVQRGVDRQPVFFSDSDCSRYLNTFGEYAERRNIAPHPVYQKLGDTQEARAYAYRKSFEEEPEGANRSAIDEEIRSATKQGVLIAGTTFAAEVARRLDHEVTAKPRGRPKKKGPEKGV
jgi:hypothetical protein